MTTSNSKGYREWLLDSLETRPVSPRAGDFVKDSDIKLTDDAMREIVEMDPFARNEEIRRRHRRARGEGHMEEVRQNLIYLTANGYGLFALDRDIEGFFAIVCANAKAFMPEGRVPLLHMPLQF